MNRLKHTLLLAILLMASASMPASAKNYVVPKAYMFFTDVQEVDSVWYQDRKKKILAGRSNYSHQLREFFATNFNLQKRTCVVVCGLKRKDVEKKYQKMVKQYTAGKNANKYDVHYINVSEFKFDTFNMDDSDQQPAPEPKKKKDKKPKPRK